MHHERRSLFIIDHTYPALITVNHLKAYFVKMDVIRDRTTLRNADVRGDEASTLSIRNQVTVIHSGTTDFPRSIVAIPVQDKRLLFRRKYQWGVRFHDFDTCSVGSGQFGGSLRKFFMIPAKQAQFPWGSGTSAFQSETYSMPADYRH
jgi:hypothetical protein